MRIYPAIDIKDGNCVRLFKGSFDKVTVYGSSPADMAMKWETLGGEFIHVVDLDGARIGEGINEDAIRKICESVKVPVQTGGGIRNEDDIEKRLSLGVNRVILGTVALNNPDMVKRAIEKFGADKIVVGIDAKDGYVAIHGWETVSKKSAVEFAVEMQNIGVKTIIYTDISTDGTLGGTNVEAMREMSSAVPDIDVIASGGIGCLDDIAALEDTGVEGVIVGKALYTGRVDLAEAIKKQKIFNTERNEIVR